MRFLTFGKIVISSLIWFVILTPFPRTVRKNYIFVILIPRRYLNAQRFWSQSTSTKVGHVHRLTGELDSEVKAWGFSREDEIGSVSPQY